MKDQFVPYHLAIQLKELGFNEPCIARYINKQFSMNALGNWWRHNSNEVGTKFLSAPLKQQAFEWLRKEYRIYSIIDKDDLDHYYVITDFNVNTFDGEVLKNQAGFKEYEHAELASLGDLIHLIKLRQNEKN